MVTIRTICFVRPKNKAQHFHQKNIESRGCYNFKIKLFPPLFFP